MGCLFSSSASEEVQRDRKRNSSGNAAGGNNNAAAGASASGAAPPATRAGGPAGNASSPAINLPQSSFGGPRTAGGGPGGVGLGTSPRPFAASYTDLRAREHDTFLAAVRQAKHEFIDVAGHARPCIGPLSAQAQARTARFEAWVASMQLPNAPAGYFSQDLPRPAAQNTLQALLAPAPAADIAVAQSAAQRLSAGLAALHAPSPAMLQRPVVVTQQDFDAMGQ